MNTSLSSADLNSLNRYIITDNKMEILDQLKVSLNNGGIESEEYKSYVLEAVHNGSVKPTLLREVARLVNLNTGNKAEENLISSGKNLKAGQKKPKKLKENTMPEAASATTENNKADKPMSGKKRGPQNLPGTDYGDGITLVKMDTPGKATSDGTFTSIWEKNNKKDDLIPFFTKLAGAGEVTVATLKKMVEEYGKSVSVVKTRLNWFSKGQYDKKNWHLFVKPVEGKPSQSDKISLRKIQDPSTIQPPAPKAKKAEGKESAPSVSK